MRIQTDIDRDAGFAAIGLGYVVPQRFTTTFMPSAGEQPPYAGSFTAVLLHGRFECVRLELEHQPDGPPIDTEGLRTIPVRHLIRAAIEGNVFGERQARNPDRPLVPLSWRPPDVSDGPTDDNLKVVMVAYRLAYASGVPPLKHVEESLGLPRSTAGRWVKLARERGFLGAAEKGRAGEAVMVED